MTRRCLPLLGLVLVTAGKAAAQGPQLASVFPAGGQRGTTVEVALEGKDLATATGLFLSKPGITAKRLKGNVFTLDIGSDAPGGDCDLWALTAKGISNPRRFTVGALPEVQEKESNDEPKSAQAVKLPAVINGTLSGTDRDYFRFDAPAGERLSLHFRSVTLDGSARPALTIFGPAGNELLHDDGRDAEPTLEFQTPVAGSYLVRVEERGYQKGDNPVYRLSIFSGPRIVAAFPQLLTRGKTERMTLYGYRLPGGQAMGKEFPPDLQQVQLDIAAPQVGDSDGGGWLPASSALFDGFRYQHPDGYGVLRFGLADGPITLDNDAAHDGAKRAQPITLPCALAGRFLRSREIDWYRLSAKKGQLLWIEGVGERGGKAMDLEVAVHDAAGKPLLTLSDFALKKGETTPFPLATVDPMGLLKVESDGDYYLVVRDLYGTTRWGAGRTYQLFASKRHEEVCVAITGGIAVPAGGSINVPVAVLRRGGHEAPIRVHAEGLPAGLEAKEITIPGKESTAMWKFSAAKDAPSWVGRLTLSVETKLDGKSRTLPVVGLATVRATPPVVRRTDGIVAAVLGKQ
jgi:hypothetical protein